MKRIVYMFITLSLFLTVECVKAKEISSFEELQSAIANEESRIDVERGIMWKSTPYIFDDVEWIEEDENLEKKVLDDISNTLTPKKEDKKTLEEELENVYTSIESLSTLKELGEDINDALDIVMNNAKKIIQSHHLSKEQAEEIFHHISQLLGINDNQKMKL